MNKEDQMREYWYDSYENMLKTNYDPMKQTGWCYGVRLISRAIKDDATDWTDVCADIMYGDYIEKWLNAPSVQYHIEHNDNINSLKKLFNRYINRIAVAKVKAINKKVNETDNTSKLSTDELEIDMDFFGEEEEEELLFENDVYTSLFSLVEDDIGTEMKDKRLYDLLSWYINNKYECTDSTERKIWSYLTVKTQHPELTLDEACKIAGVTDNTIRNFQKKIKEDNEMKKEIERTGWILTSDLENKGDWSNEALEKRYGMPKNMGINPDYYKQFGDAQIIDWETRAKKSAWEKNYGSKGE